MNTHANTHTRTAPARQTHRRATHSNGRLGCRQREVEKRAGPHAKMCARRRLRAARSPKSGANVEHAASTLRYWGLGWQCPSQSCDRQSWVVVKKINKNSIIQKNNQKHPHTSEAVSRLALTTWLRANTAASSSSPLMLKRPARSVAKMA